MGQTIGKAPVAAPEVAHLANRESVPRPVSTYTRIIQSTCRAQDEFSETCSVFHAQG